MDNRPIKSQETVLSGLLFECKQQKKILRQIKHTSSPKHGLGAQPITESSAATIGIRGTGLYLESGNARDYFCLCYGEADLASTANPDVRERVVSNGHESPRFIGNDGGPIDGLYACGNDMESVMAGYYPGPGITLGPAMTFGYVAAVHAAQGSDG